MGCLRCSWRCSCSTCAPSAASTTTERLIVTTARYVSIKLYSLDRISSAESAKEQAIEDVKAEVAELIRREVLPSGPRGDYRVEYSENSYVNDRGWMRSLWQRRECAVRVEFEVDMPERWVINLDALAQAEGLRPLGFV